MKKPKFVCPKCMATYQKWPGSKCRNPKCDATGFAILTLDQALAKDLPLPAPLLKLLIKGSDVRWPTGFVAFDRIMSHEGGVVPGTSVVLAAAPGSGKSTLLMAIAGFIAKKRKSMYASAEQDRTALNRLATKLGVDGRANLVLIACKNLKQLLAYIDQVRPSFVVIDSANDIAAHSDTSVADVVMTLHQRVEGTKMTVVIVSHVNSEGLVRGGPAVTHKCDAVLMLLGDAQKSVMRELVSAGKNRLGDTTISASLKMTAHGFVDVDARAEIRRPLSVGAAFGLIGGDILEVQAMLTARLGDRRIYLNGATSNRLRELVGVIENTGIPLGDKNITVRVTESEHSTAPSLDAAIVAALLSAVTKVALPQGTALCGEVMLSGELRGEQPEEEAKRMKLRLLGKPGKSLIRSLIQECGEAMHEEIEARKAAATQPVELAPANDGE